MSKKARPTVVLLIFFVVGSITSLGLSFETAGDLYWVCYAHINPVGQGQIFLMQIDSLGNITVRPTGVVPIDKIGQRVAAVALAKSGPDTIVLWITRQLHLGPPLVTEDGFIHRALIANPSLRFLNIRTTNIKTTNVHWLSVTQNDSENNLLAFPMSPVQTTF